MRELNKEELLQYKIHHDYHAFYDSEGLKLCEGLSTDFDTNLALAESYPNNKILGIRLGKNKKDPNKKVFFMKTSFFEDADNDRLMIPTVEVGGGNQSAAFGMFSPRQSRSKEVDSKSLMEMVEARLSVLSEKNNLELERRMLSIETLHSKALLENQRQHQSEILSLERERHDERIAREREDLQKEKEMLFQERMELEDRRLNSSDLKGLVKEGKNLMGIFTGNDDTVDTPSLAGLEVDNRNKVSAEFSFDEEEAGQIDKQEQQD